MSVARLHVLRIDCQACVSAIVGYITASKADRLESIFRGCTTGRGALIGCDVTNRGRDVVGSRCLACGRVSLPPPLSLTHTHTSPVSCALSVVCRVACQHTFPVQCALAVVCVCVCVMLHGFTCRNQLLSSIARLHVTALCTLPVLPASLVGSQPIQVYWIHNNCQVTVDSPGCLLRAVDGVHSLLVPRATADNSGEYVCEAYNEYGDTDTFCRLAVKGTAPADSGEGGGWGWGVRVQVRFPSFRWTKLRRGRMTESFS